MSAPNAPKKDKPLPCGHAPEEAKYLVGGSVLVCKVDDREWNWVRGHWKEFVKKGPPKKTLTVQPSPSSA